MYDFSMSLLGTDIRVVAGLLSALLSAYAFFPYIRDTWSGRTQPQRASWLIWSVLGSIAFASLVHEGASTSLWFAGVQVGGTIMVFLLSIRTGAGQYLKRTDYLVLVAAALGLVLWYVTDTAAYALAITISISLLGGVCTVVQAYRNPDCETMSSWALFFASACFALVSVQGIDLLLLAYPLYLFTLYGAVVGAMYLGEIRRAPRAGAYPHA